ncbi:MAG TPA: kelch repeat-containing protein [Chitinivibrionales bacterium]|nr:kelch repeat-containing protein [Chitinivibrionales bacterium]
MSQLRTLFLLMCAAAVLYVGCTPMLAGGSGSEVVGVVRDASLKAVSNATIYLDSTRADTVSQPDTSLKHHDSTSSDANGNYRFTLASNGISVYNISCSANKGALIGFKPDIVVNRPVDYNGTFIVTVDPITLAPPGAIKGKALINSLNMAGIICYIPGTSFLAMTDDSGTFLISKVPEGTYNVYYYYPGYQTGKTSSVTVIQNQVTTIPALQLSLDPAGRPLPPLSLAAAEDTVNGIVKLTWRSVKVSDLAGYIVLRQGPGDPDFVPLNAIPVTDTAYNDVVFNNPQDTTKTLIYTVRAVDADHNQSDNAISIRIDVIPPSYIRPVLYLSMISPASDTIVAGTAATAAVGFKCNITKTDTITWYAKAPDSVFLRKTAVMALAGGDTLSYVWTGSGIKKVCVNVLDERGNTWRDSIMLSVRPKAVAVTAISSTDSTVRVTWRKSADPAFAQYQLFAADTGTGTAAVVASTANVSDTTYLISTRTNGIKSYRVRVLAAQGLVSDSGIALAGGIKDSPPRFTIDTAAIPKTANAAMPYRVKLTVSDVNLDNLSFVQLSSVTGLTIADTAVAWTPGVADVGVKHISVRVSDGWGGSDTISWDVTVMPSNVWSSISPLSKARRFLSAAVINGVLYAAGGGTLQFDGMNYNLHPWDTVEAFTVASGTAWSPVASLPTARYRMACASLGGTLFCFGGAGTYDYVMHVDSFSPASNSWGAADTLYSVRVGAAVCTVGGKFYLIGGESYNGTSLTVSANIDEWDPGLGWSPKVSLQKARMDHQAVVINNKIYIIGGLGGSDPNNCVPEQSVEVFDPVQNRIDTAAPLNTGRWYFGAAEANGKIYVVGGLYSFDTDSSQASVEEYDPVKNVWSFKASLPAGRFGCAAASWQGKIYVVGGAEKDATGTKETNSVMVFYP